jgi:hypothetical protein
MLGDVPQESGGVDQCPCGGQTMEDQTFARERNPDLRILAAVEKMGSRSARVKDDGSGLMVFVEVGAWAKR